MNPHSRPELEWHYLGDGVYAAWDDLMPCTIWLATERECGWHEIAPEPAAMLKLFDVATRPRGPIKPPVAIECSSSETTNRT